MNQITIKTNELEDLFSTIGLANVKGIPYKQRIHKQRQIMDFYNHIEKAVNRLSQKRTLTLVDCACGRSYLSFIANYYLLANHKNVEFICIDNNSHVIEQSRLAAKELGFDNMYFICDDIRGTGIGSDADIVYSLHACNFATDMTIAKGIMENAKYIMTVSCCQHYVRSNLKHHPLTAITKHGIYKERMSDMLADTMRSLILEHKGYNADLFSFTPDSETPKNVMLRAEKGSFNENRAEIAWNNYMVLKDMFQIEPLLASYLNK